MAIIPPYAKALFTPRILAMLLTTLFPFSTVFIFVSGLWVIGGFFWRFSQMLIQLMIWPGKGLKRYGAKKGAWAVVTGATDGIGREFALQLAKKGFNIVLVSRNPEKLAKVASEIESQTPGTSTKTHAIDFNKASDQDYNALQRVLSDLPIGVLANNVGVTFDIPVSFALSTTADTTSIINVNCTATLRVTSIVLPGMIERKKGLILNFGSFASTIPVPMQSTYAASKSFLLTWTQCLGAELKGTGVTVQWLNASWIVSSMSKATRPSMLVPSARAFTRAALSHIGLACGSLGRPYASTPWWTHAIMDFLMENLPIKGWVVWYTHRMHKEIREKALSNKGAKAE